MQIIPTLIHPKSRGFLKLKDNNPLSHPLIYARYLTHPDDVKILVDGIKLALRLAETKALKAYGFQVCNQKLTIIFFARINSKQKLFCYSLIRHQ